MFTGIVEERGRIVDVHRDPADSGSARLTVHGPRVTSDVGHGDSIAVYEDADQPARRTGLVHPPEIIV